MTFFQDGDKWDQFYSYREKRNNENTNVDILTYFLIFKLNLIKIFIYVCFIFISE